MGYESENQSQRKIQMVRGIDEKIREQDDSKEKQFHSLGTSSTPWESMDF